MKKDTIIAIIQDFNSQVIPSFFDLKEYETDYEISRYLIKSLRIGYIKKTEISHFEKAIYINFYKNYFSVSNFRKKIKIEKEIFRDDYQNYDSNEDIYEMIKLVCKNKDSILEDALLFDKLDQQIENYSKLNYYNDYNEKETLFWEIYSQLVNLEKNGKIAREKGKRAISYLRQIIENDGPEFCYSIKFRPIWDDKREYQIGTCVRGEPLLKKLK